MHKLSAAALLILLVGMFFAEAAPEQSSVTFRGSTLRMAFGAGIIVSATSRSAGEEILRINATSGTVQPFLAKPLPVADGPKQIYPFELKIGPALFNDGACGWTAGNLKALDACFSSQRTLSVGPGIELVPLKRFPDGIAVLIRSQGVVPGYARCTLLPSEQLTPYCTVYFEQAGEWHELTTSSLVVRNMKVFQCAALELRNAIWSDAPQLPDSCRK